MLSGLFAAMPFISFWHFSDLIGRVLLSVQAINADVLGDTVGTTRLTRNTLAVWEIS